MEKSDALNIWSGAFVIHLFYKYYALLVGNIEVYRLGLIISYLMLANLIAILLTFRGDWEW